jgi:hypothetical protein
MTLSNYFGSAKNEVLKGNFFSALLSQFEKKVFKASTSTTKIIQWSKLPPKFSSIKKIYGSSADTWQARVVVTSTLMGFFRCTLLPITLEVTDSD